MSISNAIVLRKNIENDGTLYQHNFQNNYV
jgi:hypothetical protein